MSLIRQMRGGKDYDAQWQTRMRGTGPYAQMIAKRFQMATKRLVSTKSTNRSVSTASSRRRGRATSWHCFRFVLPPPCGEVTNFGYRLHPNRSPPASHRQDSAKGVRHALTRPKTLHWVQSPADFRGRCACQFLVLSDRAATGLNPQSEASGTVLRKDALAAGITLFGWNTIIWCCS